MGMTRRRIDYESACFGRDAYIWQCEWPYYSRDPVSYWQIIQDQLSALG